MSGIGSLGTHFNNSRDFDANHHQDPNTKDDSKLFEKLRSDHWLKEFLDLGATHAEEKRPLFKIAHEEDEVALQESPMQICCKGCEIETHSSQDESQKIDFHPSHEDEDFTSRILLKIA